MPDTLQKARQFALRFYIQKAGHFAFHDFHGIFEIVGGGGTFLDPKNTALCVTFLYPKNISLCTTVLYNKPDTSGYIFIYKKQCSLRYVFII